MGSIEISKIGYKNQDSGNAEFSERYLTDCFKEIQRANEFCTSYMLSVRGMVHFVNRWMNANLGFLNEMWHPKIERRMLNIVELPHINYRHCQKDPAHRGIIKTLDGLSICADHYSNGNVLCLSVLSDRENILPLETVIERVNKLPREEIHYCSSENGCQRLDELYDFQRESYESIKKCPGHIDETNETAFEFDEYVLAVYIQKWFEQSAPGEAPLFEINRQ